MLIQNSTNGGHAASLSTVDVLTALVLYAANVFFLKSNKQVQD